jgi:hypothetical protein
MQATTLADLSMSKVTELIGSDSVTPGAGAAGALTLALAAACGAKAVSISLRHSDVAQLHVALARFHELREYALLEADEDAEAFASWARSKDTGATSELIESEENMARLISAVMDTIREVEPFVRPNMAGDLTAAKALAGAAKTIQMTNEAETRSEKGRR